MNAKAMFELAVDAVFLICLTVLMSLDQIQPDTGIPLMVLTVGVKAGLVARRPARASSNSTPTDPPPSAGTGGLVTMVFGIAAAFADVLSRSGFTR